jgi:hypothetical protein
MVARAGRVRSGRMAIEADREGEPEAADRWSAAAASRRGVPPPGLPADRLVEEEELMIPHASGPAVGPGGLMVARAERVQGRPHGPTTEPGRAAEEAGADAR